MDKNQYLEGTADEFIKANMGLAQKTAWKFIPYVERNENIKFDKDDLVSIATIGLIKAYEKFDPTKATGIDGGRVRFSTYAVPMIKGEIRRHIRDMGNTIRKSRTGEVIFCDSLDKPIGEEENQTLADVVPIESYEIENKVIIKDFLSTIHPRMKKLYKLWKLDLNQIEIGKILGTSQVQVSRLLAQLIDLAREYGEQPKIEKIKKGGNWKMATDSTRKMRAEITKAEQFNIIGSAVTIAEKYGVAIPTAYAWKAKLIEKEKMEVSVIKADAVKMEVEPFPITHDTSSEVREVACEQSKPIDATILTEDDTEGLYRQGDGTWEDSAREIIYQTDHPELFEGLADPEPKWEPDELEKIEPMKPSEQIQRKWQNIEAELVLIRMLYKEQAEEMFEDRLAQAMQGLAV